MENPTEEDQDPTLMSSHNINRNAALLVATAIGLGIGYGNFLLRVDLSLSLTLLLNLILALLGTTMIHEGIHGGTGFLLGHKPHFGVKLPFVFTTFDHRVPLKEASRLSY